jgi:hypothetical protein
MSEISMLALTQKKIIEDTPLQSSSEENDKGLEWYHGLPFD